jgi:hypothetical protein
MRSLLTALLLVMVAGPVLADPVDEDQDGLPDDWELEYFDSIESCNPEDDSDTDGLTNAEEHEAGTHPLDKDTDKDGLVDGEDPEPLIRRQDQKITIRSPNGGEVWAVGSTQHIIWGTEFVYDVTVKISYDGGGPDGSWEFIDQSVDETEPGWLDYEWVVPDQPTKQAVIGMWGYNDELIYDESDAPFEIARDEDGDDLPDTWETLYFGSPEDCQPEDDPDEDGLSNAEECAALTDPTNADTDGDGLLDGNDPDPLVPAEEFSGGCTCGIGIGNGLGIVIGIARATVRSGARRRR